MVVSLHGEMLSDDGGAFQEIRAFSCYRQDFSIGIQGDPQSDRHAEPFLSSLLSISPTERKPIDLGEEP